MARALARPRGGRSGVPERERELKRLCLSVCDDTGFRLYAATYDQPKRRDELITRLSSKAKAEKVRVTRLDVAESGPATSLVGLLRAHLQGAGLPAGWRRAVMVIGIEPRLDYSSGREGVAFLHQANLLRDALPGAAPVPVVVWLSPMAISAMQREAPDLWDWRAASFDFTGDEAPRVVLLRELTTLRPEADLGLSGEERQARVQMLEELLAELEREGPPKSKRQTAERADVLLELGIETAHLARFTRAMAYFKRAIDLYREVGEQRREGDALGNLGLAYAALGDIRRATEHLKQRLKIARDIGDRRSMSWALGALGAAYASSGDTGQAIEYSDQALAIARDIRDRQVESWALNGLGMAHAAVGDIPQAMEHYEQMLAIAREVGDRRGESYALGNLGQAYAALGEPRCAIDHLEQTIAIARAIGDRREEGVALANLGNCYVSMGEPRRAFEYYEQALSIFREIGQRRNEGHSLYSVALAFDQLGERYEAIKRMEEALRIYEQIGDSLREDARAKLAEWRGEDIDGKALGASGAGRKQGRAAQ